MNNDNPASGQIGQSDPQLAATAPLSVEVDFSVAKKLPNTGTTCDVYEYRYLNRRYLVKRIRDEYVGNSVIIASFRKEIELGMELRHQALPVYHFAGKDYIAMDFVDGLTLAKMIQERDPWLGDVANVRRMLTQLIDVIDYLHPKNIVHCDVKADNVMITAGTRNVMLIDLGGAYTYANDNTSGDPNIYGLDRTKDIGNPDIDFHGVGKIVDRLIHAGLVCHKLGRFRRLCDRRGVDPRQLLEALKPRRYGMVIAASAALAALVTIVFVLLRPQTHEEDGDEETPAPDTTEAIVRQPGTISEPDLTETPAHVKPAPTIGNPISNPVGKTESEPRSLSHMAGEVLPPAIASLNPHLNRLEALVADKSLSSTQLLEAETDFAELETATMSEAMRKLSDQFPDAEYADVYKAFYGSEIYSRYIGSSNSVQKKVADEIKRRHEAARQAL